MRLPRFQFRLRTLFVVVTVAAVACGVVAAVVRRVEQLELERERADLFRQMEADERGWIKYYHQLYAHPETPGSSDQTRPPTVQK